MISEKGLSLDIYHAHTLGFISFRDNSTKNMAQLSKMTKKWLAEENRRFGLYYCFGRYDAILDIYLPFEGAPEFVSRIKKSMRLTRFSPVPMYDIEDTSGFVEDFTSPVKIYSFVNWNGKPEILWQIVNALNRDASRETYVTLSMLLGAYRYLVVARGRRLSDVFQKLQLLRREGRGNISEISSTVALDWHSKDESDREPIYAQVFMKLKEGEPIPPRIPRLWHESKIVVGAFDLALSIKAYSLAELMRDIISVRRANKHLISETSTVLAYTLPERLDDILPDVPGRLIYGELEDEEPSKRRKK
jgi:hypothetical protein